MGVDERTRRTLRRACSEALVEAEDRLTEEYEHRNSSAKWNAEDIAVMNDVLSCAAPCKSWAEESIILTQLGQRLGRPQKMIKKKAIELGHGNKVDYWVNQIQSS